MNPHRFHMDLLLVYMGEIIFVDILEMVLIFEILGHKLPMHFLNQKTCFGLSVGLDFP